MRLWKLHTRHWLLIASAFLSCAGVYGLHRTFELREEGVHPRFPMALTCVSKDCGEAVYASYISTSNDVTVVGKAVKPAALGIRTDFDFRYVGKRGPTDWYRVSWTAIDKPGITERHSEEFSFRGRPRVILDDKAIKIVAAPWQGHPAVPRLR